MTLQGKRALVIGLGKTGVAAARFLLARGAIVAAADQRERSGLPACAASLDSLPVQLHLGGHPDDLLLAQDLIVPSPGVPWDLPGLARARRRGIRTVGELELAAGALRGRVIGITGTNGKTTTASLAGHILRQASLPVTVAGNIGTPVLEIVDRSRPDQWHVLELSSFQLEASESFRCHVAAVLNVTPDHLDRHGDFKAYAAAKARIFRNQRRGDAAVLNADDERCRKMRRRGEASAVWFGASCRAGLDACAARGRILFRGEEIGSADLPIRGAHNLENALAAVAVCALAGAPPAAIDHALRTFQPVPHRMEFVAALGGVAYYNDSKATNVAAAVKACGAFPSGLWTILGGRDKGGDYRELAAALRGRTRAALLIGEAAPLIRRQLAGEVESIELGTLEAAVGYASRHAQAGDTVLLAPACASFDQFADYAQRGGEFRRLVREMEA